MENGLANALWGTVIPVILTILIPAAGVAGAFLLRQANSIFHLQQDDLILEAEKKNRDALDVALKRAGGLLVTQIGATADRGIEALPPGFLKDLVGYVRKAVPDALASFGLAPAEPSIVEDSHTTLTPKPKPSVKAALAVWSANPSLAGMSAGDIKIAEKIIAVVPQLPGMLPGHPILTELGKLFDTGLSRSAVLR